MMRLYMQLIAIESFNLGFKRQDESPPTLSSRIGRAGSICLIAWACVSCAAAPPPPSQNAIDSAALLRQIRAEIGDPVCDAPQQCSSIAVGAKSCGGPEGYLAWSSKVGNSKKLLTLVARHALDRKVEQERDGMLSDCMVAVDPGATCVAGRCTLLPRLGVLGQSAD